MTAPVPAPVVTHLQTPDPLKALYMTSWIAATPHLRTRLTKLLDTTELNAVVIDIKDDTGKITFLVEDPYLKQIGSAENRIADVRELISALHAKHVYVIGRIAVFQDAYLPKVRPELALHRISNGKLWSDRKGLLWLNQRDAEVWKYTVQIAREAYAQGFDEINFDYIRFPSDGDIQDIDYGHGTTTILNKPKELEKFFAYLRTELPGMTLSADLFGQITSSEDDMGIGQSLERAALYFDYIAPMVYPSHYYPGFLNMKNPAAQPYEVVKYALLQGSLKLQNASSSPAKLRPWLQDFSLGTNYTPAMVRAQIKATHDAGLTSWMLWDPGNHYSAAALLPK